MVPPIANIGHDLVPFAVSWRDAGECFKCALEVDFDRLPSKSEVFFVFPDLPHKKFTGEKRAGYSAGSRRTTWRSTG